MSWVKILAALFIPAIGVGCTIEARLIDMHKSLAVPEVRHDRDYQNTEVAVSGSYQVQGQIAETAEKRSSGQYTMEGVISYE
ncbi:hypothetical protein [Bdellovibrio bacteriovorus]|uniref:hypothetical protein n=1 Tax=Bdellovibrio bacteriovorus TaxID=959 RepID=UPI0035A6DD01